ncbi:hypothetical protein FRUB_02305 [Fimbriiglobus ruber]|uniref:Uncharacterized protein n=1 Tax=Fimbriiglobus ruber TaxID=1908690 RepID=A0A225DTJ9_9BACT|nr:hypothetical protein FRUB_02305 [Fimbriiglobus ruber]
MRSPQHPTPDTSKPIPAAINQICLNDIVRFSTGPRECRP